MAAGEFSAAQQAQIDRAMVQAEQTCRFEFSVYVGAAQGPPREYAHRLHTALTRPARSVLVMVDPSARRLEIVTGFEVRTVLDDDAVRDGAERMQTAFGAGDLVGGLTHGIAELAATARDRRSLT